MLRLLPAEKAHDLTLSLVERAGNFLPTAPRDDVRLQVSAMGLRFPNPIGLAAGFDKDARVPTAMLRLGFGFVECGTLTPLPQTGNPQPRLFRLTEDRAVINRMGFNNGGIENAAQRLTQRRKQGIVGLNIGANKDSVDRIADYAKGFARLAPFASYITINVSSPNTPGLRGLQNRDELERLLAEVGRAKADAGLGTPILLKIAPDLEDIALDDVAAVVMASGIAGVIVSNTTLARPDSLKNVARAEAGGLSGAPLFTLSTEILRKMRRRLSPTAIIVGVGGIASGADAYAKIRAGANLVQLYSALVFEGPGLVQRIKRELLACLARDGFQHIEEAVGRDV